MSHILVLTSSAPLTDEQVGYAAGAAGGAEIRRLANDAAEIELPDGADRRARAARDALEGAPVDVNVVIAEGREKRVLLADMDSTIIGCECIDEIADAVGVGPQVAAITEQAMQGELDFEQALLARVALLKGLPASALEDVYATRVRLNPGARTLVATMAARGAATALVSGGFTFFTARVAAAAGFAEHHANVLEIGDGALTGDVARPILGRQAKAERLAAVCAAAGVDAATVLAVGDGANDLAMVRAAGLGVAYHAKPALAAEADAVIAHADLTALLHLQGVPRAAWVA